MNVLIVDDETTVRNMMRRLLAAHPDVKVLGEAASVEQALEHIARTPPDLIFLDIQLRGETGFDLLAQLPERPARVVFVSAYDHFAIRAFECNAMDYLLKPVDHKRLALTLRRIRENASPPRMASTDDDRVCIKSEGGMRWIPWRDILCIQAEGNFTKLFLCGNETLLVSRSLKEWTEQMPPSFLKIHRQHIVQIAAIRRIQKGTGTTRRVCLCNGREINVARQYWPILKQKVTLAG